MSRCLQTVDILTYKPASTVTGIKSCYDAPMRIALFFALISLIPAAAVAQHGLIAGSSSGLGTFSIVDTGRRQARYFHPAVGPISGIAVSPDTSKAYLLNSQTGGPSGVTIIDLHTGTATSFTPVPFYGAVGFGMSPDGSRLFVVSGDSGMIQVATVDTAVPSVLRTELVPDSSIGSTEQHLAVLPDSSKLLIPDRSRTKIHVIDVATGQFLYSATVPLSHNVGIAAAGGSVVLTGMDGASTAIALLDAETLTLQSQIPLSQTTCAGSVVLEPDATRAYAIGRTACSDFAAAILYDVDFITHTAASHTPALHAPNSLALVASTHELWTGESSGLFAYTLPDFQPIANVPQPGFVTQIATDMSGAKLFCANSSISTLNFVDPITATVLTSVSTNDFNEVFGNYIGVNRVATSRDGLRTFLASPESGALTIVDNVARRVVGYRQLGGRPDLLAVSSKAGPVYTFSVSGFQGSPSYLNKINPDTGRSLLSVPFNKAVDRMDVSPDNGQLWLIARPGGVLVLDAKTFASLASIPIASASAVAFTPDSKLAYVASSDLDLPTISEVDTATLRVLRTFNLPSFPTPALQVAPDGKTLYSVSGISIVAIDLADGTIIATTRIGNHPFAAVISPDGSTIYCPSGSFLFIYDTSTKQARSQFISTGISGVGFTPY